MKLWLQSVSENTIVSAIQCFLRRNHHNSNAGLKTHSFGSSFLRKSVMSWIIDFFNNHHAAKTSVSDWSNRV